MVEGESDLGERQADAGGQEEARQEVRSRAFKRRKLYKQESGDEVPWFPHDNDMHVLKELCWESGPGVRLVIHGTPAGGAGVQGCLDYGCSVVALCYDNFHKTHMLKHIVERAVECTVTGRCLLFQDEVLQSRMVELNLSGAACDGQRDGRDATVAKAKKDTKGTKDEKKAKKGKKTMDMTPKKRKGKKKADVTPKKVRRNAAPGKKKPEVASVDLEPTDNDESAADSSHDDVSSG